MAVGTQQLGLTTTEETGYQPDEHVPPPGRDATLLAVVPIPGTRTSLAIVGYAIHMSGEQEPEPEGGPAVREPDLVAEPASELLIDHLQRRVWVGRAEITLTFQEFELLAFLSAHPAIVFSRADPVQRVWQRDFAADSRTVDVHVSRLRHKLGPAYGKHLVTEYRVGYQFRPAIG